MIVVVYNSRAPKTDLYIAGAKKARNGIGAGSVRGMAEELAKLTGPRHPDADHRGSRCVRLAGSWRGQPPTPSVGTNL